MTFNEWWKSEGKGMIPEYMPLDMSEAIREACSVAWNAAKLDCNPCVKPLGQVEGRDVFPGDKLWLNNENQWIILNATPNIIPKLLESSCGPVYITELSWNEPINDKTKPLCQIEGKDVFPGDSLWLDSEKQWVIVNRLFIHPDGAKYPPALWDESGNRWYWCSELSWNEPAKPKMVYQFAFKELTGKLVVSYGLYETEEQLKDALAIDTDFVIRLDYTAIQVPV